MALEERFLPGRGEDAVHGLARIRQPEREQIAGHQLASQPHCDVVEVDLCLRPGPVGLRDKRIHHPLAGLETDLLTAGGDVGADHLVGDVDGFMFVQQPVVDPLTVWRCFRGAVRSAFRMASITGL